MDERDAGAVDMEGWWVSMRTAEVLREAGLRLAGVNEARGRELLRQAKLELSKGWSYMVSAAKRGAGG